MTLLGRILWVAGSWIPVVLFIDDFYKGKPVDFASEWSNYTATMKQAFPRR